MWVWHDRKVLMNDINENLCLSNEMGVGGRGSGGKGFHSIEM